MTFSQPALPYLMDALEPIMDTRTVEIHYTKHHATYLNNLNAALEKHPELQHKSIEEILTHPTQLPEDIRTTVWNNGGGFYNHNLFWAGMAPNQAGNPTGLLADAIDAAFGTFEHFKTEFEKAGLGRLGSGYAWLCLKKDGALAIHTTLNQDSPLADGLFPILVVDVWEHAYYLKYQNRRAEYLTNWWKLVNWNEAVRRFVEKK